MTAHTRKHAKSLLSAARGQDTNQSHQSRTQLAVFSSEYWLASSYRAESAMDLKNLKC